VQIFVGVDRTPVSGNGDRRESKLVPSGSVGQLYLLFRHIFDQTYHLATIHALQTDDRQQTTDRRHVVFKARL